MKEALKSDWQRVLVRPPPSDVHLMIWPAHSHYLFHLYFQPERINVLRDAKAFAGLQTVPFRVTARNANALRPGYTGDSHLAPAKPIQLVIRPGHAALHLRHEKNVIG